jgi:hypothetical protein
LRGPPASWSARTAWHSLSSGLFLTLPRHYSANHWHVAWGGLDIALAIALTSTAVLTLRGSPLGEIAATVTATLLVSDAWFDVLTSHGTGNIAQAARARILGGRGLARRQRPLACANVLSLGVGVTSASQAGAAVAFSDN